MVRVYEKKNKKTLQQKLFIIWDTTKSKIETHQSTKPYNVECRMQNYNAECRIILQNVEFVVSRLGTCVKMQNQYRIEQNAILVQNRTENIMKKQQTEFRTRIEHNSAHN